VFLRHFPSGQPNFLGPLVVNGFRLLPKLFEYFWGADAVGRIAGRDRHDVDLRVGAVSQINDGGEGQIRLPGAVGGKKIVVGKTLIPSRPLSFGGEEGPLIAPLHTQRGVRSRHAVRTAGCLLL
jgi:hypothetical protein